MVSINDGFDQRYVMGLTYLETVRTCFNESSTLSINGIKARASK